MSKADTDYLILVDKDDNPIGTEEKVKCHLPNGNLHRAFTILLFNKEGKLLLTRRSQSKMLWPGDWDGTVASHPRQSETDVSSAQRRLPEEIGISCKLDYLFKFEYHVPYKNIGSENEICGTLIGIVEDDSKKAPEVYCPWMILALYFLPSSKTDISPEHKSILNVWKRKDLDQILEK